jgi:hypothetical protein
MASTKVNTLRPGSAPPTRPTRRHHRVDELPEIQPAISVPTNTKPALATRFGSSKLTPTGSNRATLGSLKVPP